MRHRSEYQAWYAMHRRCNDPRSSNYRYYGGRGIKVCSRWTDPTHGFPSFLADMGPRPGRRYSLDRIDNDGDYTPENCRWATAQQQHRNFRRNRLITINDETKPLVEWAEAFGIDHQIVRNRLWKGWTPLRALFYPVVPRQRRGSYGAR